MAFSKSRFTNVMNPTSFSKLAAFLTCTVALVLLSTGCASSRINWNERIGTYTFDQAILDFGPPDKQATLQDGSIVAEWLTQRGYSHVYPRFGYGYHNYPYWHGSAIGGSYVESPDYFLRLIFNADRKLTEAKNFSK
jgi:hypothetical protein